MATIRKRGAKWQVQIRRLGQRHISRSFNVRKDAAGWARQMEVQADRHDLPNDPKALQRVTLGQLVERYRDTVSVKKRGHGVEQIVLNAFLRHRICSKPLSEIGPSDFASYRDERLKAIKASTLRRELAPLHNMFELATNGDSHYAKTRQKVRVAGSEDGSELQKCALPRVKEAGARSRNGELDRLVTAARACAVISAA